MKLVVIGGSGNLSLAESIAGRLGTRVCPFEANRFPDGELHVEVPATVRGGDVYLVQPTGPPVDGHLMELLLLADACRRAGAGRLTAVVPYLGYARQDRRVNKGEAVGARVVADLLGVGAFERIVAVDLHNVSLEGFFGIPLEHLSAVPLLASALEGLVTDKSVLVAPDLGAVKLAERYAELLHRPITIVHKTRLSGEEVRVYGIVGEVAGRTPVIVDDMVSTAGTIEAAAAALSATGCLREITVVASHALLVGPALRRLSTLPLKRLLVTDSLPVAEHGSLPLQVVSLAPMLAETLARLNGGESMS